VYWSNVRFRKKKELNLHNIESINLYKTAFLIRSAVRLAYFSSYNFSKSILSILDFFSICVGLAFQIKDDISDLKNDTYPLIQNIQKSKIKINELYEKAFLALNNLKKKGFNVSFLEQLTKFIIKDIK